MSTTTTTEWTVKPGHIGMGPSVIDAAGNEVCHIPAAGTRVERMRLANRIAALPTLLAALRLAESSLDTYQTVGAFTPGQPSGWLLRTIRAAIASATP